MFGQSHLFAPNYPRFSPMGGAMIGLGRGDSARKRNPGPPPWACEKCAKAHSPEMGCPDDGEIILKPGTRDYYEVETTRDIDEVLGAPHSHRNREEQLGCKKCKEGQKRRKRAAEREAYANPYTMHGLPVTNMGALGQDAQYTCPVGSQTHDPSLNCMKDARGNTVCSDGKRYPPGCPQTPPDEYFTAGVTPDVTTNGRIEGQVPAPRSGAGGISPLAIGAGVLAVGGLLFVLFK